MIQIDRVNFIPNLPYTEFAQTQLTENAVKDLSKSQEIYVLRGPEPLFCAGLLRPTLVSKPYLWIVACEALSRKHLKELREVFNRMVPNNAWVLVRPDLDNEKFLTFFGFKPTSYLGDYLVMEL